MRLLLAMLLCLGGTSYAQLSRTIYFNATGKTTSQANAAFYTIITQNAKDTLLYWTQTFTLSKSEMVSGSYRAQKYPVRWEKLHEPAFMDAKKEGVHKEYHANGLLKFEGNFRNDRGEGKHLRYYESSKPLSEITLINGLEEGKVKSWYENGQLKMECNTSKGLMEGELTEWEENGKKKASATFQKGKMVGKVKRYAYNGDEIPQE